MKPTAFHLQIAAFFIGLNLAGANDSPAPWIWNGSTTDSTKYPEVFAIEMTSKSEDQMCTGVLVHPRLILTAAHCFRGTRVLRIANGTQVSRPKFRGTIASLKRKVSHPSYRPMKGKTLTQVEAHAKYDIAFIELSSPLSKITLPAIQWGDATPAPLQKPIKLVGYGMDDFSDIASGSYDVGTKLVGTKTLDIALPGLLVTTGSTHGALPGDSGGPAFLDGSPRILLGVMHSFLTDEGRYYGTAIHRFTRDSLCWVKTASKIDFIPALNCAGN